MTDTLLDAVRRNRDDLANRVKTMLDNAETQHRALNAAEDAEYKAMLEDLAAFGTRIAELEGQESRERAAATVRADGGTEAGEQRTAGRVTSEPATYRRGDPTSPSFFLDVYRAKVTGDPDAWGRLRRNEQEQIEKRALGNTGAVGGSGGEFAPPGWVIDQFVALARPSRPAADLLNHQDLPSGVSSINLPKVATGTSTAIQTTQNSALSQTDATTTFVSSGIATIGGKQVVSQQLLDQSPINFDEVIVGDLAADYAKQLDAQTLSGTGTGGQLAGFLGVSGINNVVYTSASPTPMGLYSKMAQALATVNNTRFMPIQAWLMTPLRWGWMLAGADSNSRPLFLGDSGGQPFNAAGIVSRVAAESVVGMMHGLPVVLDSQIPIVGGQDTVVGARFSDLWLYEGPLQAEALRETYGDSLGVLFRVYAYSAAIPNRQPKSIVTVTGTGLAYPPTFP